MINRLFSLGVYEYMRGSVQREAIMQSFYNAAKGCPDVPSTPSIAMKCHRHFAGRNRKYALKYLEQAANLDRVFPALDECGGPESNRCAGAQSAVSRRWRS
jgi:hypothetical protein